MRAITARAGLMPGRTDLLPTEDSEAEVAPLRDLGSP